MKPLLAILCASVCWGQASPTSPTLPQSVPPGVRPTPTGSVIPVHSGNNLQTIYNAAACGSDIVLDAGATFTGSFIFNKQCSAPNWILVEGAGCANGSVSIPTYVSTAAGNLNYTTAPYAPPALTNYATLTAASGPPLVTTDNSYNAGAYNYFGCLEVATPSTFNFSLIVLATAAISETLPSQFGDHFILDRLYVHGNPSDATNQIVHGIVVAGSNVAVINSYVSNIYYSGGDSQAILGWAGPGPYLVKNNFLSAGSEILLFGGTGKTPGNSCTVAASPATTHATVNTCIDAMGGAVATPPIGTQVMFYTSAAMPYYSPLDSVVISGNTAGALTFPATSLTPLTGAGKIVWGMRPNDNTVTQNYFWKNPCWNSANPCYDGIVRQIKNFLETKYGQRWNINGNIFNYTYNDLQAYAFNFNSADQNGDCPWCFSSDITFKNNLVKNIASAFQVIGTQAGGALGSCPPLVNRILIQNNLFWPNGSTPYIPSSSATYGLFGLNRDNGGCTFPQNTGADSIQVLHNTFLGFGTNGFVAVPPTPVNFSNFVLRDNITEFDQYRWFQDFQFCTDPCFNITTNSGTWSADHNAIINSGAINGGTGISDTVMRTRYGAIILNTLYDTSIATNYSGAPFANYSTVNTDYHGFALTGGGGWINAASDGTNPGVNFVTLDAALGGGAPGPCSISPATLGPWTNTQAISQTITTTCSGGTITWTSSGLPVGLSGCNGVTGTSCLLSGTLSVAGSYFPTITATASNTTSISPPINVNAVPSISTVTLPNATSGMAYSQALSISGGTSPFTCSVSSGTLAGSGLTLGPSCTVVGTPTSTVTTYSFTARVTDTNGVSATRPLTVSVTGSPCDLNGDGIVNVQDTQLAVNMSLSIIPCTANINGANVCNTVTIQRVVTASLGGACTVGP